MFRKKLVALPDTNWTMPFLFTNSMIFLPILKEILQDEFNVIKYVYGSSSCLWAGGRPIPLEFKNIRVIEKTLTRILDYNVIPAFTLSSITLTKDDLKDSYCNNLLSLLSDTNSQIIVASDILYDYIKEKYPNIKLIASVIKFFVNKFDSIEEETEYINKLIENYDRVVIRSEYFMRAKNKLRENIKDLSKLVILVNSTCMMDCPGAKHHYEEISRFYKKEIDYKEGLASFMEYCPKVYNPLIKKNTLSFKDIEDAVNMGITNLKLQGRQVEFKEMSSILIKNFFSKRADAKRLIKDIDRYCSMKMQNSLDLQMYSIMKNL